MTEKIDFEDEITFEPAVDRHAIAERIIVAYVENQPVDIDEIHKVISTIHKSVFSVFTTKQRNPSNIPAIPAQESVHDDFIVCLEDGRRLRSLTRHLKKYYGMSPDEYRTKWGLPYDYPMAAPAYARLRSIQAKEQGLGRKKTKGAGR